MTLYFPNPQVGRNGSLWLPCYYVVRAQVVAHADLTFGWRPPDTGSIRIGGVTGVLRTPSHRLFSKMMKENFFFQKLKFSPPPPLNSQLSKFSDESYVFQEVKILQTHCRCKLPSSRSPVHHNVIVITKNNFGTARVNSQWPPNISHKKKRSNLPSNSFNDDQC